MSLQNSGLGAMQGVLQEQNNHPMASSQDGTPSTVPELPTALPLAPLTDTYTAFGGTPTISEQVSCFSMVSSFMEVWDQQPQDYE